MQFAECLRRGCIENGLKYLEVNNIRDRYKAIIISEKAIEGIDKSINKGHLIVDYENLLEKLNISHAGFVVVKFRESVIINMYSLNPETNLNALKGDSISKLSEVNSPSCANCGD